MNAIIEVILSALVLPFLWLHRAEEWAVTFFVNAGPCPLCGSRRNKLFDRIGDRLLVWCLSCRRASSKPATDTEAAT